MKRNVDLNEISDGRLYSSGDMVKADCRDCKGCSACCRGMGFSIILDPMDIWRLGQGTGKDFAALMSGNDIELGMADGMVLPNLKMDGERDACPFLDAEGRCSVHAYRPGLCRLFPLGRYYEEGGFRYFIQVHECGKKNRSKVKVKKWLGIPDIRQYEAFVLAWHDYLKKVGSQVKQAREEARMKELTMSVLKLFYLLPYEKEDFYGQFRERLSRAE